MNGSSNPRSTGYWKDALIVARTVIEDSGLLPPTEADKLAEAVTERLLGDFLAMAEASSDIVFGMDGTGPFCSWCGRLPGPELPAGHPQRGIFCECKREKKNTGEPGETAASAAPLDIHDELFDALAALPPRQRAALVLRYFLDLSEAEVAAALHCSLGTVKSSTSRGLKRLEETLRPTNHNRSIAS